MTDKTPSDNEKRLPEKVENAVVIEDESNIGQKSQTKRNEAPKNSTEKKPAKTGGLWFFSVFNFLLIILICAAAYWYYTQIAGDESVKKTTVLRLEQQLLEQSQKLADIDKQNRTLNQSVNKAIDAQNQNLDQQKLSFEQRLSQLNAKQGESIDTIQNAIDENAQSTDALARRLAEMSGRRPSDWLLAEANYLVNMAGRKLYLEKDVRTAMTLLKEADARLDDLNDPALFPVRALIAGDLQNLAQVNPTSTNSIALALAGMLAKIGELELDKLQLPEPEEEDLTLTEDISDWRQNLSKTYRAIVGDLISIDYADEPLEPYIAERQQWLIEQQLKHALTIAQTAALDEQVELYRTSLQQAMGMIVEHYQLDDDKVNQFLVAIQELQNQDFSRSYPSKLESQASLKDIIETRIQGLFNNSSEDKANNNDSLGNQL